MKKRSSVRGDVDILRKTPSGTFRGLLEQDMPIVRKPGKDPRGMSGTAGNALNVLAELPEKPELLDSYLSRTECEGVWERFEAALVLSYALQEGVRPTEVVAGLERMLNDDDEMMRQLALEGVVEHSWSTRNFRELDMLLSIAEIREEVLYRIVSASIRNNESHTPESLQYVISTIAQQAHAGNEIALMYVAEMEAMERGE
jgi:hypothetical protein